MKNIIKRGTSLLLVLAMLLSFAAVVGAEEPTTTTPEKILTLTVENKLLRAGQTEYLAVYEEVAKGYKITGLTISATSTNSKVVVKGVYPWIPKSYLGDGQWDYDDNAKETVFTSRSVGGDPLAVPPTADPLLVWTSTGGFQTSDKPLCFIAVEAQEDVTPGAYQINICRNPHPENPDDHFLFAYPDPVTNKDLSQTEENAILNPGTAVVIPADATLPTVILTKTAFEAPTMAGLAAGGEAAGDYDLTKYVKLVTEEGLVDVTSLSVTMQGDNYVSLKADGKTLSLATASEKDKEYKLTVTAANGKQLAAAVELPFTVSKNPVFTMAGFTKNNGYATAADIVGSKSVDAPLYGATNPKVISFDPRAFDQYGVPLSESQYAATTERHLYSDEDCTSNEITTGNAVESVTVSDGSLLISGNLQTDVWCKVRASATVNGETKYSDWCTFQIKSNYPQPRKAILSLTDGTNLVSNIIEIPTGETTKTITFSVDHFIDQFGNTMDENTKPKYYTVNFKVLTAAPVPGVEYTSNDTITVTSTAASYAPITGTFEVLSEGTSIAAYLTDTTTPATLTIKKADPIASSLASKKNDEDTFHDGEIYEKGSGTGNVTLTELPGIGEKKTVELVPLYVLDQYDQPITNEYAQAANFQLYKVDGTTETKIDSDCVKFEKVGNTHVKLLLINKPGTDGKVVLKEGTYKIKAEWSLTKDSPVLTAESAPFTLTQEANTPIIGAKPEYDASTLDVPYKYGQPTTTPTTQVTVRAKFENKYGPTAVAGSNFVTTLSDITLNDKPIETGDTPITYTDNQAGSLTITVNSSAAKYFGDKTEIPLTATMTATYGTGENDKVDNIPISITLRKDPSTLSAVYIGMDTKPDLEMPKWTWNVNVGDSEKETTINLTSPETETKYYFDIKYFDQYGLNMESTFGTNTEPGTTGLKWQGGSDMLIAEANAEGTFSLTAPGNDRTYVFNVTFAKMRFVNDENEDYKVNMMLDTTARTYAQDSLLTWADVYSKMRYGNGEKLYIRNENGLKGAEVNTSDVKVVIKQNGAEVFDSSKNYTEAPKANAGDYTIELIYVKQEGAEAKKTEYPIDSTPFQITPKEVTIKVTGGTIRKEYDGTQSLVLPSGVTLTAGDIPMLVDSSALQYASENAGTDIQIELVPGEITCLTGDAAINYTAGLSELKGTITPRKLIVTPKTRTFTYGQDTEINAALEREYTVSNNLEGTKAATITGSMKLTTMSDADVTVYNAGTYNVALGNLSLTGTSAGNYQLELASGTHWTISKKSVDAFNVTLEADFGVYGSELYTMLNTAKVTVDGQQVNLSTLYNVEALSIKDVDENNVTKTDALVNAGEYTVTSLPATTLGTANYEFKTAPTLKINVKPHVLTDADVQLSGETSAGFDGTKKTVTVKVSFTYNRRPVTLTENTDYTITGEVEASNAGGHYLTVTAKPNGNLSGSVQKRWQIWPYSISPSDITFKQTSTSSYTYNGSQQELQKSDVTWTVTDTTKKAFLEQYFTANDFYLHDYSRTDAGNHTAIAMLTGNFVATRNSGPFTIPWKIKQSKVHTISNQTPSTKYGQPGSLTVTLSEGQYKGLTNGAWTVRDIGDIFESAVAEYKDGVVTINWKLKDTTKAGDTGSFKVTVPASTNYEGYEFTVTVNVTAKDAQTGFGFTYASASVGYAEDTYTNPVQNAKTTPAYTSSNQNVATVASNGVVTIRDVGTTIITANAPENGEYASATASYTLTVVRSTLTVTASSATMTANDSVPSFTASVTGLKRGQTTAQVFQTLTASAATDGKTAGTFRVTPNATFKTGGRKNWSECYDLYFVAGTLTVNPAQTAIDVVLPIIIGGNTCANGYANCACESFYDLDASRWYHEAIDWAYSLGLMNGTTRSTFGPNAAATRAQTWTMLARIAGQDTRRSSTWYEVGQKRAMNLGITDGTNPMGSLTREQLAAMLYRYVGSPAVNGTLTFTDSANVSAWARNAMIWAVQNGILDGVGGNRLNPKGTTTRAQAAAIFMRFSKLINK